MLPFHLLLISSLLPTSIPYMRTPYLNDRMFQYFRSLSYGPCSARIHKNDLKFFFSHHLKFCLAPFEWPGYRCLGRGRSQGCLVLAQFGVFGGEWEARRSSTEQGENRCRVFRMPLGLYFHSRNPAIHATPAVGSRLHQSHQLY